MKVLAILNSYAPISRVGAWITTHEYLARLAARGHDVHVMCLLSVHPHYLLDGVHVHPNTWRDYEPPDLVVSHLGDYGEGASYAAKLGVPSVRFGHGHDTNNAFKLDQFPTALAVFSSQALADDTAWSGPQMVAHPPVLAAKYRTDPGSLVTLANLSPEKGGELFQLVATSMPTTKFLGVVGAWGRQVKQMPSNVKVLPTVQDMRAVYARTRVLLMPSLRESYGRVGVEAAYSGIPTIAHPSPGLREALGDAAVWVDRNDFDGWVEAIESLRDWRTWADASTRATELAQTLTPDETVTEVVDAIEALASVTA